MDFEKGAYATTRIGMEWHDDNDCVLSIDSAEGDLGVIPEKRSYELCLYGAEPCRNLKISAGSAGKDGDDGAESVLSISDCIYDEKKHCLKIILPDMPVSMNIRIVISGLKLAQNDKKSEMIELLDHAWTIMDYKEKH